MARKVLIVGASVAGVGCANELRKLGFAGEITLVDAQRHLPYDRPPLSKDLLLNVLRAESVAFHDLGHYQERCIDLKLGCSGISLDATSRSIVLDTGERLFADAIILATGSRARLFPKERASGHVWTIRHVDDAIGLRSSLAPGVRLAVIGGGFIGAEVASSARKLGTDVTIYEAAQMPFKAILGSEVAEKIVALHRRSGVSLECGSAVLNIGRSPVGGQDLQLSNGCSARADVVVAGLGAIPNVEWLAGSDLLLSDGVVCDEFGQTGVAGIYAAGDVASWRDPFTGQHIRAEHWTSAREQARIVAQEIVAERQVRWEDHVPYFWSDLHGSRIQVLGNPQWADEVRFVGAEGADNVFVAEYRRRGHLVGVAGCNAAGKTMRYRTQLATARSQSDVGSHA